MSRIAKSMQTEGRSVVSWAYGEGRMGYDY